MEPWRDCGWRTGLGTCFYNRRSEVERLSSLLDGFSLVVLVGPRNAGKSELARYTLLRVKRVKPMIVDARRVVAKAGLGERLEPLGERVVGAVARIVEEKAGLGALLDLVSGIHRELALDEYVVIDEVHLVARDALRELEALAKLLRFYPEYRRWKMIVTCSEGFLLAQGLADRLDGYGARILLLEPLSEEDAHALYEEYVEKRGCRLGWSLYWGLIGGLPGYLPDYCAMNPDELRHWVQERLTSLISALLEAAREARIDPAEALRAAHELLVEGQPVLTPLHLTLSKVLVHKNIAYQAGLRLKPQLRVYTVALALWASHGYNKPPNPQDVIKAVEEDVVYNPRKREEGPQFQ